MACLSMALFSLSLLVNHKNSYSKILNKKLNKRKLLLLLVAAFSVLKEIEHDVLDLTQAKRYDLSVSSECFSFRLKAQMDGG